MICKNILSFHLKAKSTVLNNSFWAYMECPSLVFMMFRDSSWLASSWQFYKVIYVSGVPFLLIVPEDHTLAITQALEPQVNPTNNCLRLFGPQILILPPSVSVEWDLQTKGFNIITTNDSEILRLKPLLNWSQVRQHCSLCTYNFTSSWKSTLNIDSCYPC